MEKTRQFFRDNLKKKPGRAASYNAVDVDAADTGAQLAMDPRCCDATRTLWLQVAKRVGRGEP